MSARRVVAVAAAAVLAIGCAGSDDTSSPSGNPSTPTEKTCADACASIYTCAASLGYDLSDTLGTQGDCVTRCETTICGPTYAASVRACIVSVPCTGTVDVWGATTLACDTSDCSYDLPLPVGSCNDRGAVGKCQDFLGIDASSASYSASYCTVQDHGTWVSTCPTENRKAVCVYEYFGSHSRIVYYASFTGDLAAAEASCRAMYGFKSWTVL